MMSRRLVFTTSVLATAILFFMLGVRPRQAPRRGEPRVVRREAGCDSNRGTVRAREVGAGRDCGAGRHDRARWQAKSRAADASRERMVSEIKEQLQTEMGLLPVHLLRDRRASFVELYSYDNLGKTNYGTAGYLGGGYFITVKHAVVALRDDDERQSGRKIQSVKVVYQGKEIPAKVIDTGDADVEVHSGDWAIIKTRRAGSAGAARRLRVRVRLRRSDLPPWQRLLEGDHPLDRLRRAAHHQRPGHLPHRRPPWRVGRRRPRPARQPRRHPDRPDAGRLPLLVHPADSRRDAAEAADLRAAGQSRPPAWPSPKTSTERIEDETAESAEIAKPNVFSAGSARFAVPSLRR